MLKYNEFVKNVDENILDSFNEEVLRNTYKNMWDLTSELGYEIDFVPVFSDTRYFEVKDKNKAVVGGLFITKDCFNMYIHAPIFFFRCDVQKIKNDNQEDVYIRNYQYNIIKDIYQNNSYFGKKAISHLETAEEEYKNDIFIEISGKKYYSPYQVTTEELFNKDYLYHVKGTTYEFDYDELMPTEDVFVAYFKDTKNACYYVDKDYDRTYGASKIIKNKKDLKSALPEVRVFTEKNVNWADSILNPDYFSEIENRLTFNVEKMFIGDNLKSLKSMDPDVYLDEESEQNKE